VTNVDVHGAGSEERVNAPGGEGEDGDKVKPHQRILRSKWFVPTLVVAALVIFVFMSTKMGGSPPRLDSIVPSTAKPGEVVILTGRNFGATRETSEVRIFGIAPTSTDYTDWSDTRISVKIPEEATSGIVYVITKNGRSGVLLFINRADIPVPVSGATHQGDPYLPANAIQPAAAHIGDLITIRGMNFGLEPGNSKVYFTSAALQGASSGTLDPKNMLPADDYNGDSVSWSNIEITLRVPDGAVSGNVLVTSDKGTSNASYFVVNKGAGSKTYSSPRKYSMQYSTDITVTQAAGENALYLWMPVLLRAPEQPRPNTVSIDPAPLLETASADLFSFTNLQKGGKYKVSMSWMLDRYKIETQVNPGDVPLPDTTSDLYKTFTAPDTYVPSANTDIVKAAVMVVGAEKNPWLKARRIYDWLLTQVTYSPAAKDTVAALKTKRGDVFVFSSLYCALLRAQGVPARMVSGYLIGEQGQAAQRHFWDEFYIDTLGWIPVDPFLGDDGTRAPSSLAVGTDARAYYFGNLDNQHIVLTKGLDTVSQMLPAGVARQDRDLPYMLSFQEEAVGGGFSYSTSFEDLTVTGWY
jgi:hypothetical protein